MRHALAAAALCLLACKPAQPTQSPEPTTSVPAAEPATPVEGAEEPSTTPTSQAMTKIQLVRGEPYALQERALEPVGRPLVPKAEAFLAWIGETEGGLRLFSQIRRNGLQRGMALIDGKGRTLTKLLYVWGVHEDAGFARINQRVAGPPGADRDGVVDLVTGKVSSPNPQLPAGETAAMTMLLGAEQSDEVWVISKAKSKRVFAGLWSDRSSAAVDVKTEIPFWPDCRDAEGATLAAELIPEPSAAAGMDLDGHPQTGCINQSLRPVAPGTPMSPDCARIDFHSDGTVTCRATRDGGNVWGIFVGGWGITVDNGSATELTSPDGITGPVPMPNIWGVWSDKVLFYSEGSAVLWHPDKSTRLPGGIVDVDSPGVAGANISPETPVLPLSPYEHTAWLDFEGEVVYVHDMPLRTHAKYRAVGRRFLATRIEDTGVSLHEVDLEARSVRHVADYQDCEHLDIRVQELHPGQFSVSCQNLETLFWTELIDLELGMRGSVEHGWIEEEQLDRDRILISKRERPVQHTKELRFYRFKE